MATKPIWISAKEMKHRLDADTGRTTCGLVFKEPYPVCNRADPMCRICTRSKREPLGEPVTVLDRRYSDPEAQPTTWEDTRLAIEAAELFWLTTVRTDSRPHVTPVVAVWVDGALHFTTGAEEQKAANLRANSRVLLTTGCNSWNEGLDVVLEGEAVRVTEASELRRLGEAWRTKWDGRWRFFVQDDSLHHPDGFDVLAYAVEPTKVLAFAKGSFSHTVHRFKSR